MCWHMRTSKVPSALSKVLPPLSILLYGSSDSLRWNPCPCQFLSLFARALESVSHCSHRSLQRPTRYSGSSKPIALSRHHIHLLHLTRPPFRGVSLPSLSSIILNHCTHTLLACLLFLSFPPYAFLQLDPSPPESRETRPSPPLARPELWSQPTSWISRQSSYRRPESAAGLILDRRDDSTPSDQSKDPAQVIPSPRIRPCVALFYALASGSPAIRVIDLACCLRLSRIDPSNVNPSMTATSSLVLVAEPRPLCSLSSFTYSMPTCSQPPTPPPPPPPPILPILQLYIVPLIPPGSRLFAPPLDLLLFSSSSSARPSTPFWSSPHVLRSASGPSSSHSAVTPCAQAAYSRPTHTRIHAHTPLPPPRRLFRQLYNPSLVIASLFES